MNRETSVEKKKTMSELERFKSVVAKLRDPETGCPWDRVQTMMSLRRYLIEEAGEYLDALEAGDFDAVKDEMGDLLMQVVLNCRIAEEEGKFTLEDVAKSEADKMIRRHPHVFGDAKATNANEVNDLWEQVKLAEKAAEPADKHLLDDVPVHFPALLQAQKISRKAVAAGFEWDTIDDVWDKVAEERAELQAAYDAAPKTEDGRILREADVDDRTSAKLVSEAEMEFGDLLFALVNVARKMGIDAESALRASNAKFRRRFARVEDAARAEGRSIEDLTIDEMEAHWQHAKEEE